ncbi:MAG TPA: phosphopantetheine-binding protein [Chloroflexia bacterium]|nr:phosphopantetheine-binding protein [Chloroflexia bacterium]
MTGSEDWRAVVRRLLAAVLDRPAAALAALPDDTPLFGPELNLDSFSGMVLLVAIERDYGCDLAADDLGLESLETIGTLAAYLRGASARPPAPG